ncbi:MAG: GNAT family N-acetyltransferase [Anaerolineae bacterium]|nr:GNAT family N-acetyltransferase [Anaerolineae bacterium]
MTFTIRAAENQDAEILSALAYRSKAHWGYDDTFMQGAGQLLTITPMIILLHPIFVAEIDREIVGFYGLRVWRDEPKIERAVELDYLFIEPVYIGKGIGRGLFKHAIKTAAALGYRTMVIAADPNAEVFYEKMGAVTFAGFPSDLVENRVLPLMRYELSE